MTTKKRPARVSARATSGSTAARASGDPACGTLGGATFAAPVTGAGATGDAALPTATLTVSCEETARVPSGETIFKESA